MTSASEPEKGSSSNESGATTSRGSLRGDVEEVHHYLSRVLLFASLPSIGIPGLISKWLHIEEFMTLWELIVATAPLTIAVTMIVIATLSKNYGVGQLVFLTGVLLLGSIVVGQAFGRTPPAVFDEKLGALPVAIFRILGGYLKLYGLWSFFSSLVVGGFLGWVWSAKILPRLATR